MEVLNALNFENHVANAEIGISYSAVYRVFHSGVDYFEVKYLANPLPDLFQILHGEPGDMYN